MKNSRTGMVGSILCLLIGTIFTPSFVGGGVSASSGDGKETDHPDFFTSFEEGDQQLTWKDTVEIAPNGKEKSHGVDGNISHDAIQGDITEEIASIQADGNNPPNEIDSNLIDRNDQTKWLSHKNTAKITIKMKNPAAVVKYAFTSANDAQKRDPQNWTLYGSNDGENWSQLDKQEDVQFEKRYQRKIFEIDNDKKFGYYRVDITKNAGDSLTQLAELALSNGVDAPPPPPSPMKSHKGDGPTSSYTGKTRVGWTGKSALTYQGTHLEKGRAYSYNKLFDVDIKVTPEMQLSYYIHPEFADKDQLDFSSTYASIDLAFSDGTYLSELGAKDNHRVGMSPQAQGKSNTLYPNQWNYRSSDIGELAAGKTIKRILVAYDNPDGPGQFKGSIDDIKIEDKPEQKSYENPIDYVNTLRGTNANGTFSRGNNIPAVAVPHGFNFWTPVTDAGSDWLYSYQQSNNADNLPEIEAFSLSHEPSPWMGDRQTFQVMPAGTDQPSLNRSKRALSFQHANEIARPDYYKVAFNNGIKTEITPTDHAAMFRFTFNEEKSSLIFDNVNDNGGLTLMPDDQSIQGYTDVKSGLSTGATRMFIYATFDKAVQDSGKLTGEKRDNVGGYFSFDTSKGNTVTMKIATSLISVDQAKKNLEQEIHPKDTFSSVKQRAQAQWNDKLSKIEVEGASEDELVTLYSNMYRLFLYPNRMYENVGSTDNPDYQYASAFSEPSGKSTETKTGAKIVKGKPYVNNGLWDTYRTAWPAYALFSPKEAGEMIDGFVQQYRDGGWISRWSSPGYADLMTGTSADVAFADAYLKGVKNFDVDNFYKAALKDASVVSANSGTGRKGLSTSVFDGYTNTDTHQGMSWAMAGYLNDFAIANLSKELADQTSKDDKKHKEYEDNYQYYINRSQDYVNMFNPEVDFFMGRKPSGDWRTTPDKYDPRDWAGDYTETNAWGMAFDAPYDGQGLANLYGGRKGLAKKLDKFFSTPETAQHPEGYLIHEMREARDVRMGMYAHSNQPSHHILYMYEYAGQPWKTQEKIREVLSRLYIGSEIGQGYAGDEDNGEMSAWYLFNAAGFYPLRMGTASYAIGAPYFKKMTIHLENGKDIVINAPKVSDKNKYIQDMKLNGKSYNKLTLDHKDIADGATLDFEMGSTPSEWGTGKDALLPSITPVTEDGASSVPKPLKDLTDGLIQEDKGSVRDSEGNHTAELFDNTSKSQWSVDKQSPSIQYQFLEGSQEAEMYTITSAKDDQKSDPKSWVLKGSNDGENWTELDHRTDETFKWRLYTRPFSIEKPGKYAYYKLEITENGGGSSTSMAEVELLGHVYEKAPITGVAPKEKVVVQPDSVTSFDLGVKNASQQKMKVDWKASLPKGFDMKPQSGKVTVDADKTEMISLQLKVSKDVAEGLYTVPIQLSSGSDKWPGLQVKVYVSKPGNLFPFFNNKGISKDSNPNANFDLVGYSYSDRALHEAGFTPGKTVTFHGADFNWPNVEPNSPDNVLAEGQTIPMKGNGPKLHFLGAASHGPSTGVGKILYTDGTTQNFNLGFSDWTLNGDKKEVMEGNDAVASLPYRNSGSGKSNTKNYLFYTSVPLDPEKMVDSIILPDENTTDQGEIHVFSMSIKYTSPENIAGMQTLVKRMKAEGAFSTNDAFQALQIHLEAINHFADKGDAEKVVKHLNGLQKLLNQQKKNELISKEAYHALRVFTDYLIGKWQ